MLVNYWIFMLIVIGGLYLNGFKVIASSDVNITRSLSSNSDYSITVNTYYNYNYYTSSCSTNQLTSKVSNNICSYIQNYHGNQIYGIVTCNDDYINNPYITLYSDSNCKKRLCSTYYSQSDTCFSLYCNNALTQYLQMKITCEKKQHNKALSFIQVIIIVSYVISSIIIFCVIVYLIWLFRLFPSRFFRSQTAIFPNNLPNEDEPVVQSHIDNHPPLDSLDMIEQNHIERHHSLHHFIVDNEDEDSEQHIYQQTHQHHQQQSTEPNVFYFFCCYSQYWMFLFYRSHQLNDIRFPVNPNQQPQQQPNYNHSIPQPHSNRRYIQEMNHIQNNNQPIVTNHSDHHSNSQDIYQVQTIEATIQSETLVILLDN